MVYKSENKTKDGRQWYFRTYVKDFEGNKKQYRSPRFLTKKEAERQEELFDLENKTTLHKKFDIVSLSYFNDLKTKNSTRQSYLYDYNKHIKPFFGDKDIYTLEIKNIKQWHNYMDNKNLTTNFKNKVNTLLSNILNYAVVNYGLQNNYCKIYGRFKDTNETPKEEKIRYITYDEFRKFISVVDEPRFIALFTLAFFTGMRKSEMYALTWYDIDFDTGFINVTKTLSRDNSITTTKTGQNRKIKMNRSLLEEMLKYKHIQQEYNDFTEGEFVFGRKLPIARTTVDRYKHNYFQKSGVHEITMHEFRHSAVSLILNKMLEEDSTLDINKALFILSSRFGHSPEVMIKTYAHFYEDRLQNSVVDILDNL